MVIRLFVAVFASTNIGAFLRGNRPQNREEPPQERYGEAMWSYFETEMNKRLTDFDVDESASARVRSALTEPLPGSASGMKDVAAKLGLSRRTLQRKLEEEHTTFQKQLNGTRELLAIHYIRNTDMNANDIAHPLDYQEVNSFCGRSQSGQA